MTADSSLSPRKRLQNAISDSPDDEPESMLWSGVYSAKSMIGSWAAAGVATALVPIMLAFSPMAGNGTVWMVSGILLLIAWVWLVGLSVYRKLSNFYELTNQRLKHRDGILFRKANRIELIDIDDVMYSQGPVQAMMGLGTINIKSSDTSHPELHMVGIADVKKVADTIDDARRAERRKRGLHIETV